MIHRRTYGHLEHTQTLYTIHRQTCRQYRTHTDTLHDTQTGIRTLRTHTDTLYNTQTGTWTLGTHTDTLHIKQTDIQTIEHITDTLHVKQTDIKEAVKKGRVGVGDKGPAIKEKKLF